MAFGQFFLSHNAYLLFEDKSPRPKSGYLTYPEMVDAQNLTHWQNKNYAKFGIRSLVVLNEAKDTAAIRQFNSNGFIVARDTFTWNEHHNKHQAKFRYEYSLKEKEIKEMLLLRSIEPDTFIFTKLDNVYHYNKNNLLIKAARYAESDTTTTRIEFDTNGIMKEYRQYGQGAREEKYNYEFDERGRLTGIPGSGFKLVYDDRQHCIRAFNNDECYATYYITRKSHIVQNYCCPLSEKNERKDYHPMTKTTTIFDNRLRIESISVSEVWQTGQTGKNLCEEPEPAFSITRYKYNTVGLLSEVSMDGVKEKITFHYFDKNKREIR